MTIQRLAVCDDDPTMVAAICQVLKTYPSTAQAQVMTANSGEELLAHPGLENLQAVLLDMEMKTLNGIETGRRLKALNPEVLLIFITGHGDYALQAYEIDGFQYLLKPVTAERLRLVMDQVTRRLEERRLFKARQRRIVLHTKEQLVQVPYEEVLFIEKKLRKLTVYTLTESYECYGTLKKLQENLDSHWFLQCHQGFLVNRFRIRRLTSEGLHVEGYEAIIPVSRRYRPAVKAALEEQLFD
ncbi:LytTR family DNA-binding domain-containing protein [Anoxynatronum sibiricum]|uniref:Stage 0 sporulation protein A homolog n=1 Tax=Anoxynatronum sibiricum TaxID=210623 RepID=A0ABU9VXR3_9CLOT